MGSFLWSYNLFHPSQQWFRKFFSYETQLAIFPHCLYAKTGTNLQKGFILLEFASAFFKMT